MRQREQANRDRTHVNIYPRFLHFEACLLPYFPNCAAISTCILLNLESDRVVEAETKHGGACALFAIFLDLAATFRKNNDNGDGLGMPE